MFETKNNGESVSLQEQLIRECEAMAKHAFAAGLKVPGEAVETLETFLEKKGDASGKSDTAPVIDAGEKDIKKLIDVHDKLSRIVEPALPGTILLLGNENKKKEFWNFLGPVPFIRRMMLAAIISLVLFIGISLSPHISTNATWDLFSDSGLELLIQELFLLCAAGLGASFSALFKANRYIMSGNFDPKLESSYWIRFVLGIMAGMLLATMIPIEKAVESGFGKPLLAMLGGFAADMVYKILTRLIETVASLVRGDMKGMIDAQKRELMVRQSEENMKNRSQMTSQLMELQQQVDSGMPPGEIKGKIKQLMEKLVQ